jgi:signal transduction histidine kinase
MLVVLTFAVGAAGLAEVLVPLSSRQGSGAAFPASLAVLVGVGSLWWSRDRPLVPMIVVPLVWLPLAVVGTYVLFYGQFLPLEIALFMASRHGRGREPLVAAGIAGGTLLAVDLFVSQLQAPGEIFFHWTVTILVWSAGTGLRTLERRAHESTQRAIAAEVSAVHQALEAVIEERTRIARELHDIVGHAVSSMVVQAGAAEQAADDAVFVAEALGHIRATGHEALEEMRRLVTMLRTEEDLPLTPQPRIDALPALTSIAGGPDVRLTVQGEPRRLSPGLDLTVYRIVQEALTNARRHSGASTCAVTLVYGADDVRIDVVDDGRGGSLDGTTGHGLVGMRERVALYGGTLDVGPASGGGFAVRATLPVAP